MAFWRRLKAPRAAAGGDGSTGVGSHSASRGAARLGPHQPVESQRGYSSAASRRTRSRSVTTCSRPGQWWWRCPFGNMRAERDAGGFSYISMVAMSARRRSLLPHNAVGKRELTWSFSNVISSTRLGRATTMRSFVPCFCTTCRMMMPLNYCTAQGQAARQLVLINDLSRCGTGLLLAHLAGRLLTTSDVVRIDGPLSVRAAFTPAEAAQLAARAGLAGATVESALAVSVCASMAPAIASGVIS